MKKSEIYYYISIAALFMTFLTGFGFIVSIILLVLVGSEKQRLNAISNLDLNSEELHQLQVAKKLSIINIIINVVLIILAVIFIAVVFGFAIFNIDALMPDYHN
jgi:hypothetical protein